VLPVEVAVVAVVGLRHLGVEKDPCSTSQSRAQGLGANMGIQMFDSLFPFTCLLAA